MEEWGIGQECVCLAEEKRDFQRYIEDYFEHFVGYENFQWRHVKGFYNCIKSNLDKIWSLRMFCAFIFKLFCSFDCEDYQLITKIIFIYHEVLNKYETLDLCALCTQLNNPKHRFYEDFVPSRSILNKVNKISENTYRFTNRELYSKLTIDAIYEGDFVFLKFLVMYGLSSFPDNELQETTFHLKQLITLYCVLKDLDKNDSEKDAFVEFVLKQLFDKENQSLKRINLIVVYVIRCFDRCLGNNYYADYVKCLKLYTLTLTETVISLKDVKDFLSLAFIDDKTFITNTCSVFKEIFPECPELSTPRSLKYLCRCTVRDHIKKFPSLPVVVSGIQIPENVKEYLLFYDF